MKENFSESQANEQRSSKQRSYHRLLELYYNSNFATQVNLLRKCIPDLDYHSQNRFIKKSDKIWVQSNLNRIYQNACDRLQKLLLAKNLITISSVQKFSEEFEALPIEKKQLIKQQSRFNKRNNPITSKIIRQKSIRNQSFSIQCMNSQPSADNEIPNSRNSFSSKRQYRVSKIRKNLDQIINNTRYIQKLERVKLQSTFTEFYFQKQGNPQDLPQFNQRNLNLNKLKIMTNIRCNFNIQQKISQNLFRESVLKYQNTSQNTKARHFLGLQTLKLNQTLYRPKNKNNTLKKYQRTYINF